MFDDGGSIITPGTPIAEPCRCQVDVATEAMRSEAGYADKDVALIVLAFDRALDTEATVQVTSGPHIGSYSVQTVAGDAIGSHYVCRGRPV